MAFADLAARRAYDRARYHRFRASGGCGRCGRPAGRFTHCQGCRVRGANGVRLRRRQRALEVAA